jgi:hypothetical protein
MKSIVFWDVTVFDLVEGTDVPEVSAKQRSKQSNLCQLIWHYITENNTHNVHCYENLRLHLFTDFQCLICALVCKVIP